MGRPLRYAQLVNLTRECKPSIILEVGVCHGYNAQAMILAALEFNHVWYYGFDLFEDYTNEILESEASPKPYSMASIRMLLSGPGVQIELIKGFTRDTLPEFLKRGIKPDFVFIDGGHSIETVTNDWNCIEQIMHEETIVVFDDYVSEYETIGWGCNPVVENLDGFEIEVLPTADIFKLKKIGSDERVRSKVYLAKVNRVVS